MSAQERSSESWVSKDWTTYRSLPLVVRVVEAVGIEAVGGKLGPSRLPFGKDLLPKVLEGGSFTGEAASQANDGNIFHRD